ncbi:MAG: hypothetical protein ACRDV9_07430 [Acidimicrobiia bacterium]
MVVVEHDVALLGVACDRLVALDAGRVIASGTPGEVLDDPAVIRAYLGMPASAASGVTER